MKVLVIEMEKGTMVADLFVEDSPETVAYFSDLVEEGFYDGMAFFQAIDGFLLKSGCRYNTGLGGNGFFLKSELDVPKRQLEEGMMALVHAGRDGNSTQFIICLDDEWAHHLNKELPRIGLIRTDYLSILRKIRKGDVIKAMRIEDRAEGHDRAYKIPSYV